MSADEEREGWMDGRTACGAHGLALQEATAAISSAAQGTGPGEGPGKHSTWAVARAGGNQPQTPATGERR